MIYVLIGRWLADRNSATAILVAGTAGAVQFFIVTNFCVWLFQPWEPNVLHPYSRDLAGLFECYLAALGFVQNESVELHPFMLVKDFRLGFAWMIIGDLVFTTAYLWLYGKLVRSMSPATPPVAAEMPT
jgi:hypothetical protein